MRVILHIGMAKAGSTALQTGLSDLRGPLREAGVLYPTSPVIRTKQPLLTAGTLSARRLPRYLRHKLGADLSNVAAQVEAWFQEVSRAASAYRPTVLLLSDEWLFGIKDSASLERLARRLRSVGEPVEVVAYIRRPSDHYLSMAQQTLKASHKIRQPRGMAYRAPLEAYAKHVADTLSVLPYDRARWPGGDILRHFLDTFVPDAEVAHHEVEQRPNQSLSAEAMSILADYRKAHWPEANGRFTPDTTRLIQALAAADTTVGGSRRPQLHEPVRRFIDQASTDLLFLRDEYGIVFDGIDYGMVGDPQDAEPSTDSVEGICHVDPARKADLVLHTLRQVAEPAS